MSNARYMERGVSAKKEDVHQAIESVDQGIFPSAFCKVVEDYIANDPEYCVAMHADGVGTKAALAYLYYKETGNLSVFDGIAQDAVVMNTDDLLCIGAYQTMLFSSTIARNKHLISGKVIAQIIQGNEKVLQQFSTLGSKIIATGGETADVGDLVRTLVIDATVVTRLPKKEVITNQKVKAGDIIIGLASDGQTSYESKYNSGIGSNGLTSARHDLLQPIYREKYPETFDANTPIELCYTGRYLISDPLEGTPLSIGEAILSPTRTYLPILKEVLEEARDSISALVHCTGGGQTKSMRFGEEIGYIKNQMFKIPSIFRAIQEASNTSWEEMYQVFNMGHRMEIIAFRRKNWKKISSERSTNRILCCE